MQIVVGDGGYRRPVQDPSLLFELRLETKNNQGVGPAPPGAADRILYLWPLLLTGNSAIKFTHK